jgi:hypothetical protein
MIIRLPPDTPVEDISIGLKDLSSAKTAKIFAISGPTTSNTLDICGTVVATCIGNALK